ncbi:unnamed protein product, partial [Adineta ricciae]
MVENQANDYPIVETKFVLYGIQDINSGLITYICAVNPSCKRPAVIARSNYQIFPPTYPIYNMSGWVEGCLPRDSVFLSTLQCLYKDEYCFLFFLSYVTQTVTDGLSHSSLSRFKPLIHDPTSHYLPNTTISTIVDRLMLEDWNSTSSYEKFYESCAPIYCSYSESIRKHTFLGIMMILVSMIGGIVLSLRILTPYLVKFTLRVLRILETKPNQTQQIQQNRVNRLKALIQNLIKLLRTTLIELNIFSSRDFVSNIDRMLAKIYGRWATRLYIVLFISSLIILIFYTIIQPYSSQTSFKQPSFMYYTQLKGMYGDKFKCSCSRIASTYNQFVQIEPIFHPICLSKFVSKEWRDNLTDGLIPNLTIYEQRDYRRFLSAHLQYLQGLCQLSKRTVNNFINEFLTSLLVTVELLSEHNFDHHLNISIEQSKLKAPALFSRLLFFTQSIIHGNALISTYGTNFKYINIIDGSAQTRAPTEALIYDDNCSCGLSPKCTTQAVFIETNTSENVSVNGMRIGCTPSESLLASTLECFYDQLCINLIQQYTNYPNSSTPLPTNSSRFSQNTTVDELQRRLFIERWSTHKNYSSYYDQCSPLSCSYTTIEKFNIFNIFTLILGLHGGLTMVLRWICPKFIQIGLKIYHYRKRRTVTVHPTNSTVQHTTWNCANEPTNITNRNNVITHTRSMSKIVFIIMLLLSTLIGIITFSIYYIRQENIPISNTSNTSLSTTMSTYSSTLISFEPLCQLKVQRLALNPLCTCMISGPYLIADLNDDNQVDFIFSCDGNSTVNVLFANSNCSSQIYIPTLISITITQIYVNDMNNDEQADIILVNNNMYSTSIYILFGNNGEPFQWQDWKILFLAEPTVDLSIIDLNNDNTLDVIGVGEKGDKIYFYFGNGAGTFTTQILTLFSEFIIDPKQLIVVDFDNDTCLDIAVLDGRSFHMHVFFGNTNGSFQLQKQIF